MQNVSKAYQDSMESSLREQGYIKVTLSIINKEAQSSATVSSGSFAYFSNSSNVFKDRTTDVVDYATLETNFTRVDGTMKFLPRQSSSATLNDTGLVSQNVISGTYTIKFSFSTTEAKKSKGFTIDFGENYPTRFSVYINGTLLSNETANTASKWHTENIFTTTASTNTVTIYVFQMNNTGDRLRIRSALIGYTLVYDNDDVITSTLDSYLSPISAELPQIDFSVKLKNYDHYFTWDNLDSTVYYLDGNREVDVEYGYQLPESDEIEWLKGAHMLVSDWDIDDTSATLHCQDAFRSLDGTYKGTGEASNCYVLAEDVLKRAGISNYFIDPYLKTVTTTLPLQRVSYKEALQMIANLSCCALSYSRDGAIQIVTSEDTSFYTISSMTNNGEASDSDFASVVTGAKNTVTLMRDNFFGIKDQTTYQNYLKMLQYGYWAVYDSTSIDTDERTYISSAVSNANCTFTTNPVITITMASAKTKHAMRFAFGSSLPAEFVIKSYNGSTLVSQFIISEDEISTYCTIVRDFGFANIIKLEFTKTAEPNSQIKLKSFGCTYSPVFTMTRQNMLSTPSANAPDTYNKITVYSYKYTVDIDSATARTLIQLNSDTNAKGAVVTYIFDESYGNYAASWYHGLYEFGDITASGEYFVTITYTSAPSGRDFLLQGDKFNIGTSSSVTKSLSGDGTAVEWKNPIVDTDTRSSNIAEWLCHYYNRIEYEYDTRGNPELDVGDIIYQENDDLEGMLVQVIQYQLTFEQGFSGHIRTRRIGG